MDTQELSKFLDANKAEFEQHIKQKVMDSISQRVAWDLPGLIQKQVIDFYNVELAPEVNKHLVENKEAIMQLVMKASLEASEEVAKAMVLRVKETMDPKNYNRNAVFKALFDVR